MASFFVFGLDIRRCVRICVSGRTRGIAPKKDKKKMFCKIYKQTTRHIEHSDGTVNCHTRLFVVHDSPFSFFSVPCLLPFAHLCFILHAASLTLDSAAAVAFQQKEAQCYI